MSMRRQDAETFARAIRALLATPLVQRRENSDMFRDIAVHRGELRRWFEDNLGWRLHIDLPAGVARLHKRAAVLDHRRGLKRPRGARRPFDRLRYQLLCLACAQLLRRPHVTMGDLADSLARLTASDGDLIEFDPTRHAHRLAFVDVLVWLQQTGAIDATAGNLEGFSSTEQTNAVVKANTTVIPLLLSSETPPSRVEVGCDLERAEEWIEALALEPRHAQVEQDPQAAERDQRLAWSRHQVLRRLLDDPVMDLQTLPTAAHNYLQSPAGRDKALKVVEEAGLSVERHADTWLAIDPTLESSDAPALFGSRPSVPQQVAGILLRVLVSSDPDGSRRLLPRSIKALEAELTAQMERHPKWARGARKAGAAATCHEALQLLAGFGLIYLDDDEVRPRPAAARFVVNLGTPSPDETKEN